MIVIDPAGRRLHYQTFTFEPQKSWISTRTFNYPTEWQLEIPEAQICLMIEAAFQIRSLSQSFRNQPSGRASPRLALCAAGHKRPRVCRAQLDLRPETLRISRGSQSPNAEIGASDLAA